MISVMILRSMGHIDKSGVSSDDNSRMGGPTDSARHFLQTWAVSGESVPGLERLVFRLGTSVYIDVLFKYACFDVLAR